MAAIGKVHVVTEQVAGGQPCGEGDPVATPTSTLHSFTGVRASVNDVSLVRKQVGEDVGEVVQLQRGVWHFSGFRERFDRLDEFVLDLEAEACVPRDVARED